MDPLDDDNDREFLLRCALTFNWDILISFCARLLEILTSSSSNRKLEHHQRQRNAARWQLLKKDQWGNTALHAACYNKPPLQAVMSILNCATAASIDNYHLFLTRDGSTPLIIACGTGASFNVIQVLLNPPRQNGGIAVSIPDHRGCTPLSELTIHYELTRKSPFHSKRSLPLDQVNLLLDDSNINGDDPLLEDYWTKVELLIHSAWMSSQRGPWISLVHGAAAICDSCPTVLTSLLCRCYPAMTSFASRKGFLPLHFAVQQSKVLMIDNNDLQEEPQQSTADYMIDNVSLIRQRCKWIQTLTEIYPASVKQLYPVNGRSLFCQAIASKLHWHIPRRRDNEETVGPLQYLWKCDPGCLSTIDSVSGLYPFLLAGTMTTTNEKESTNQLDTIYCLFRLHPHLLETLAPSQLS